eukprot:jgi/Ulvmu1/4766/UM020_0051.1
MDFSNKDMRAITFVAGFLNQIVHIPVSTDTIMSAAMDEGSLSTMWRILIDLTLVHISGFPKEPQSRLCKLWGVLTEEGDDDDALPVEGRQLVQEHIDSLGFTGVDVFSSRSSCELLHACAWLMSQTRFFEAYTSCNGSEISVYPPLPYGILAECCSEASSRDTQVAFQCPNGNVPRETWAAIDHTAHGAKRVHGKVEFLQKQLQHECVSYATLQQRMHRIIKSKNVRATPYEAIVADSPRLLQEHVDSFSALGAETRLRQATVELVPHFLLLVQNGMQAIRRSSTNTPMADAISHTMVMPPRILQYDEAELEQVVNEQERASLAALENAQEAVLCQHRQTKARHGEIGCGMSVSCMQLSHRAVKQCITEELRRCAHGKQWHMPIHAQLYSHANQEAMQFPAHKQWTLPTKGDCTMEVCASPRHCHQSKAEATEDTAALCTTSIQLAKLTAVERARIRGSVRQIIQLLPGMVIHGL